MKNIYILLFLFLAFSFNLSADDFDEFWYEDEILTADEENLILLGNIIDGENVKSGAVVFNLGDYSYHSLKFNKIKPYLYNWRTITNSTNKLIGIQTDSNFTVYNYKTRDFISQFDLTFSYSENIIFSSNGNQLYIINNNTDSLNIIDIETGNLIEKKKIEYMSEGYNYRTFSEFENYIVLSNGDSLVFYNLENDSIINRMKWNSDYSKLQFTDSGNLLVGIDTNKVFISNASDLSLINEIELDLGVIHPGLIESDIWFSNKGKYMYINPAGSSFMNIVDTESDTLIARTGSRYHTDRMFPLFITPDKSKAIGLESSGYWCDRGPIPRYQMFPFIYSPISENKIRPIPNTFVNNVESALFGNYHNKLAITSNIVRKGKETAISDENKEFIRYVFVNDTPVLFFDNENYLVYSNNDSLNFYNLDKNEFDKSIEFYNNEEYSYKYYSTNDIIVAFNSDSLKIINYDNLSIENKYSIVDIGLDTNIKLDESPRLVSYSNNSLNSFNIITEQTETRTIDGIPEGYEFIDFTPNGNYILYKNEDLKSGLYYTKSKTFKSHDMSNNQFVFEYSYKYMLLGNLPIMYIAVNYQDFPYNIDYYTYDFDKEESIEIGEENKYVYPMGNTRIYPFDNFFYNSDYSRILGVTCPYVTTLHEFREPITSVEVTETKEILLYPNPTKAELNLDNLDYNQLTNVVIYDSYGKLVLSIGTINTSNKLNVENLPAGVYFLKSNEVQHKFVKY